VNRGGCNTDSVSHLKRWKKRYLEDGESPSPFYLHLITQFDLYIHSFILISQRSFQIRPVARYLQVKMFSKSIILLGVAAFSLAEPIPQADVSSELASAASVLASVLSGAPTLPSFVESVLKNRHPLISLPNRHRLPNDNTSMVLFSARQRQERSFQP
jgi:hypothetical protein